MPIRDCNDMLSCYLDSIRQPKRNPEQKATEMNNNVYMLTGRTVTAKRLGGEIILQGRLICDDAETGMYRVIANPDDFYVFRENDVADVRFSTILIGAK